MLPLSIRLLALALVVRWAKIDEGSNQCLHRRPPYQLCCSYTVRKAAHLLTSLILNCVLCNRQILAMSLFTTNSWLPIQKPIRLLAIVFIFWKTVLVLVVLSSPGPGYDTSTALLDLEDTTTRDCSVLCPTATSLEPAILKFVRWDAIYFTHIVRRGHVFEQEWAFGLGFSTPVSLLSSGILTHGPREIAY